MKEDTNLFYAVAVMYYEDGLNQEEIAKRMNLSRPVVSRILTKAQECGIVKITVRKPEPIENLSGLLEQALGVSKVYVAPNTNVSKDCIETRISAISDYASQIVISELRNLKNIGVGWGSTIYNTMMRMVEKQVSDFSHEHNVVPIVGSVGVREVHYQVNIIVSLLAHVLGGSVFFYNSAEASEENFREKYRDLFEIWDNLDAVVFGLGSSPQTQKIPFNAIKGTTPSEIPEMKDAVGDILGQYFSEFGMIANNWGEGYLGLSVDRLKKVDRRVCICGGKEKVDSISTAAKLGLYNVLITDARTAEEILEKKEVFAKTSKENER